MHRRWRDVDAAGKDVPGMFPTAQPEEDGE
jgi:hypothetical protein